VTERHRGGRGVPPRSTPTWRASCAAVAATLLLLAAGCGGEGKPKATASPSLRAPTSSPSPADGPGAGEQQALAAYQGMWRAYSEAGRVGDPASAELRRYASGDALRALVSALEANKRQGLVSTGEIKTDPHVTKLVPTASPTRADIQDCLDTTTATRVKANGAPFKDTP